MIRIRIALDAGDRIVGVEARGHAGAAPHGEDIVCAAVSALLQALVVGFDQVLGFDTGWKRGDGHLAIELPESADSAGGAGVLLQTVCLSLRQIARQYPELVTVEEKRRRSRSGGRRKGEPSRASASSAPTSSRRRGKSASAQEASHE